MVKLQDFAQSMGVTDRAIQKHIKKYAEELDGLIERKGPNGTWLTDEACELLRSKMKQQSIAVFDEDPRLKELQDRVRELEARVDKKEQLLAIAQEQVQRAQERADLLQEQAREVKLLEADIERRIQNEKEIAARAVSAENRLSETEEELKVAREWLEDITTANFWERRKILKDFKKSKE